MKCVKTIFRAILFYAPNWSDEWTSYGCFSGFLCPLNCSEEKFKCLGGFLGAFRSDFRQHCALVMVFKVLVLYLVVIRATGIRIFNLWNCFLICLVAVALLPNVVDSSQQPCHHGDPHITDPSSHQASTNHSSDSAHKINSTNKSRDSPGTNYLLKAQELR